MDRKFPDQNFAEVDIGVLKGILVIRPNSKYSGKESLKVQLMVNGIKPLPILGRSLESLPPGKSVLYELNKPDNS